MVQVDDRGVPYELGEEGTAPPRSADAELLDLIGDRVDRFDYAYLGRAGNHFELVKRTTRRQLEGDGPSDTPPIDPDQSVEVRPMTAADAIPFVRNVYRSYGYTYVRDWAYHAEEVVQLLESGVLTAWVAVTADGEGGREPSSLSRVVKGSPTYVRGGQLTQRAVSDINPHG